MSVSPEEGRLSLPLQLHPGGDDPSPLYVFYNYPSVPIEKENFFKLFSHLETILARPFTRFFLFGDVKNTDEELVDNVEMTQNCEVVHLSNRTKGQFEAALCERVKRICLNGNGSIALVSDYGNFSSLLEDLTASDWSTTLFHPPNPCNPLLNSVDHAHALPIHREVVQQKPILPVFDSPSPPCDAQRDFAPFATKHQAKKNSCQCPQWEDPVHADDVFCPLWHPESSCEFYPQCRLGAEKCRYAHPFCHPDGCTCFRKDNQLNHLLID